MEELKETMEAAIIGELNRANTTFPLFNSKHEGYAVILEEYQETEEALKDLEAGLNELWMGKIRNEHGLPFPPSTEDLYNLALNVVCEAAQTAAMILKYSLSQEMDEPGNKDMMAAVKERMVG